MKCKYANLDVFEVKTPEQLKIINDVLKSELPKRKTEPVQPPKFNPAFWESDDNND